MSDSPMVNRFLRKSFGPSADGASDAELLGRFKRGGDQTAFECLVWRHIGVVLRTAKHIVSDNHLAEDIAQSVFLTLSRKPPEIGNHTLVAWLHVVTCRIAFRASRKFRKSCPDTSGDLGFVADRVEGSPDARSSIVHEEVARLPEKYRLPILLSYYQGYTQQEMADRLGCPLGTVATRVAKAKRILESRLTRRIAGTTAPALLLAISNESASAAPSFVLDTVRFVVECQAGTVPALSSTASLLSKTYLRDSLIKKVSMTFAVCLLGVGAITSIGYARGPSPDAPVASISVPSLPVLAPAPKNAHRVVKLDPKIVEAYAKLGATSATLTYSKSGIPQSQLPIKGEDPGIPLPCFYFSAEEFPATLPEQLPEVGVPFALDFSQCELTGSWFTLIAKTQNLEALYLRECTLSAEDLKVLSSLKSLRYIDLTKSDLTKEHVKVLAKMNSLRALNLEGTNLDDQSLDLLGHLPLVTLNVSQTGVTSNGLVEYLKGSKSVRHIQFENISGSVPWDEIVQTRDLLTATGDPEVLNKATVERLTASKKLHLAPGLKSRDEYIPKSYKDVRAIELSEESDTSVLEALTQLSEVEEIQFAGNQCPVEMAELLARFPKLKYVSLPLGAESSVVKKILELQHLEQLVIPPTIVTEEIFLHAYDLKKLHVLCGMRIPDEKVKRNESSVTSFHVQNPGKATAVALANLATLKSFTFQENPAEPTGSVPFLVECAKLGLLHKLRQCNPPNCHPTSDKEMKRLVVMQRVSEEFWNAVFDHCTGLESIEMFGRNINDDMIRVLVREKRCHLLSLAHSKDAERPKNQEEMVSIDLAGTAVTLEGYRRLAKLSETLQIAPPASWLQADKVGSWIDEGWLLRTPWVTGDKGRRPKTIEDVETIRFPFLIGDEALAELSRLGNLRTVEFRSSIAPDKIKAFKAKLPRCQVNIVMNENSD